MNIPLRMSEVGTGDGEFDGEFDGKVTIVRKW